MMKRFIRSELGASSAEYALIVALIGGIGMAALALKDAVTAAVSQESRSIVADSDDAGGGSAPGGTPTPTPTATPTPTPPGNGGGNGNGNGNGQPGNGNGNGKGNK